MLSADAYLFVHMPTFGLQMQEVLELCVCYGAWSRQRAIVSSLLAFTFIYNVLHTTSTCCVLAAA